MWYFSINLNWVTAFNFDTDATIYVYEIADGKTLEKEIKCINKEKKALKDLVKRLKDCKDQMDPEAIQTIVYSVGKDNGYKENLREWFKAIYEIIFGDQDGPRMGFFISFFGVKETTELLMNKLK